MEVDEEELVKTMSGGQQFKRPTSMPVPLSLLLREHVCHACWWVKTWSVAMLSEEAQGSRSHKLPVCASGRKAHSLLLSVYFPALGKMLSLADTWSGDSVV